MSNILLKFWSIGRVIILFSSIASCQQTKPICYGVSPLPFVCVNTILKEDTFVCRTGFDGRCDLLVDSGYGEIVLRFTSDYDIDSTFFFMAGKIEKLSVVIDVLNKKIVQSTIKTYPYTIDDLFKR